MRFRKTRIIFIAVALMVGFFLAAPLMAQDDPVVDSATPSSAIQGTYDLKVQIVGSNFGRGAEVSFHEPHPEAGTFGPEVHGIAVKNVRVRGSSQILVTLDVADDAYVGDTDIQVLYQGRKGKGTTMFKVLSKDSSQPSDCMLDFDATFDDLWDSDTGKWIDGVRSDKQYEDFVVLFDEGPYYAFGGTGLRLDTNGSMKLETNKDTRFITIDFSNSNSDGCKDKSNNPAGAAGFCIAEKGTDMRFEHQVQILEDNGLCLLEEGDAPMRVTMGFSFLQSPGGMLTNEFKNGRQNGGDNSSTTLRLNYGCQGLNLLQEDLRIGLGTPDYRAAVTRIGQFTWRIEGEWACLHTNLGHKLEDGVGNTIYLRMPFGLTIVDVNAPPNN